MSYLPLSTMRNLFAELALAFTFLTTLLLSNPCLAAKGGNGGGKPGGGDPPSPEAPIALSITRVAIPGLSAGLYGFNEQMALVGSLIDAPGGRRGLAYLPSVGADAFYLDDMDFGLQKPQPLTDWHTRSAVDINIHGTIVGNMEQDGVPSDTYVRPMYITGATDGTPVLHSLGPFDEDAWHEGAAGVNDSGDMLIWSEKRLPDDSRVNSLYIGNPGLHDQPVTPFAEIDFSSAGFLAPTIPNLSIHITNRRADSQATIAGRIVDSGQSYTFRVNSDGTDLEIAPDYVAEDGSIQTWTSGSDVNSSGAVAGAAVAEPAKQGKLKSSRYAAVWEYGSSEILPADGGSPFDAAWQSAMHNDNNDLLLTSGQEPALWHRDWSETNGPLDVAGLLDPSDPNASLYSGSVFDLTNRDSNDWPTLIARGSEVVDEVSHPYWLLLSPELTSVTQLAGTTAVPEPASAMLAVFAVAPLALFRRSGGRAVSAA